MKLRNPQVDLALQIDDSLFENLVRLGKSHSPNEFGGLLVGHYSQSMDTVLITDTILPKRFKSSRFGFERDVSDLRPQLEELYNCDPPVHYVGDWHTHPEGQPIPSMTDAKAIRSIVSDRDVLIQNPVMLIIGFVSGRVQFGFYVLFDDKLYEYE